LQKHKLAKEAKKNQQIVKVETKHIVLVVKKKRQQTYNVIFIWDKRLNLNPKPFSILY
jgi:hypothetical protein